MFITNKTCHRMTSAIGVYTSLDNAIELLNEISRELNRLQELPLTSKTIDRQLAPEIDNHILKPIDDLVFKLERSMADDKNVPPELRGLVNSLVSFARLQSQAKTPSRSQRAVPQAELDETQFAHAAPAA